MSEPRYWEDYEVGKKYPLGSTSFTEQEIVDFARLYDPQSFHVDRAAAAQSMFGGLIASGWHVASKMMRLFVDSYLDNRTALGSPGLDELRWLKPVRPGDTLTGWVECAAKVPSKSRPALGVIHEHWSVTNQKGELVMTTKGINMVKRRPDEQMGMKRAVKGLDHVVVMVDGIDAAQVAYAKLGFQVQPRGFHKKLGTANHLMIFDKDYFEILGIVEDSPFNAERREWLKDGGGLANVALATDGAELAFEAFKATGLQPDAPLFFDRAVEVAGKTEHAQFRTVRIPKTHMPVVGFFVCEHITPQFVYRAEWAKHPNGARGIAGVTVIAEQPAKWISELEKYFGAGSARREGEGLVVDTGTQPIYYLARKDYVTRYPGIVPVRPGDHPALLSIRVASLAACEALLRKNGVKVVKPDAGRLLVPPSEAAHLTLEFAER